MSDEFRFCGMTLTIDAAATSPRPAAEATIFNRMVPFQLGVHFDATEQTKAATDDVGCDKGSAGFNIYYHQMAC